MLVWEVQGFKIKVVIRMRGLESVFHLDNKDNVNHSCNLLALWTPLSLNLFFIFFFFLEIKIINIFVFLIVKTLGGNTVFCKLQQ